MYDLSICKILEYFIGSSEIYIENRKKLHFIDFPCTLADTYLDF